MEPLFLPYCVLVYTEPASTLAIVLGLLLHVRRCTIWAAAALLFACLIRQSNIAWAALMAIWLMIESGQGGRGRFEPQLAYGSRARGLT